MSLQILNLLRKSKVSERISLAELIKTIKPIDSTLKDIDILEEEVLNEDRNISLLQTRFLDSKSILSESTKNKDILNNRLKSEKYSNIHERIKEYHFMVDKRNSAKKSDWCIKSWSIK